MAGKSQAVMQTVMNYGWSLAFMALVFAALVYLGVFKPDKLISENAYIGAGMSVQEFNVNEDSITLYLRNDAGKPYYDVIVTAAACNNGSGANSTPVRITDGSVKKIAFECLSTGSPDSVFRSALSMSYSTMEGVTDATSGHPVDRNSVVNHTSPGGRISKRIEPGRTYT